MTCVWTPDEDTLGDEWENLSVEVRERALLLATSALVNLTYNRVGTCPITIRPMIARSGCGWNPHNQSGQWFNGTGGTPDQFEIPGPVGYIEEMKIHGEVIDLYNGDWRMDDGYILVWQGDTPSPLIASQDLSKPDTAPNTWSLTYSRSHLVSEEGQIAVATLALEFSRALAKTSKKCSLPRGVTSVARNGVNFTIEAGLFPNGLTGIDMVDQFIIKWAPAGSPTQAAQVFDPRQVRSRLTGAVPRPSGWA